MVSIFLFYPNYQKVIIIKKEDVKKNWVNKEVWYMPLEIVIDIRNNEDMCPVIWDIEDNDIPPCVEKKKIWYCNKCDIWAEDKDNLEDNCLCFKDAEE